MRRPGGRRHGACWYPAVNDTRERLQQQVEEWCAEAKRLGDCGRDADALAVYRQAADAMPGAPWLQQRTAELARKLHMSEVAIVHFRRAAAAFQTAGFQKRSFTPLRAAWTVARHALPDSTPLFVELSRELAELQTSLGLAADASVTLEYANEALRRAGVRDLVA